MARAQAWDKGNARRPSLSGAGCTLNLQGECLLKSVPSGVPPLPRPHPSHVQEH